MTYKQHKISEARHKILAQPEVVYTVRCSAEHCNCTNIGTDCQRGFFSLWIQAMYGRVQANNLKIDCYVDFGDKPYLYSDPERGGGDLNFWNYYYEQELKPGATVIPSIYEEDYPLRIWKRSHLREINNSAVRSLSLKKEAEEYINALTAKCKEQPTLGIHLRRTDHGEEVPPVTLGAYKKTISRYISRFEKIFVATDDQIALNDLFSEFGEDRFIYQEAIRSSDNQPVHTNMSHADRYRLGLEVLADCYALSSCNRAFLSHSNVSYGALLLNPELPYNLMETKLSLYSRWKTGLVYLLDRWGIRKM